MSSRRWSRRQEYGDRVAGRWEWIAERPGLRVGVTTSRRERTTSTAIVTGRQALLVDPAWDPDELGWIAADLAAAGIAVTAGFATHAHYDHLLWHPAFGHGPRWASAQVVDAARTERTELIDGLGPDWPADLAELVGRVTPIDGPSFPWPGPDDHLGPNSQAGPGSPVEIELITHDAHAAGHTALWLRAARVLIAGDMLSDVELPLLERSSAAEYAAGLQKLSPYVDRAAVVIPGHGTPTGGPAAGRARRDADRRYLDDLMTGAAPTDHRLTLAGMADAHQANRRHVLARPGRT